VSDEPGGVRESPFDRLRLSLRDRMRANEIAQRIAREDGVPLRVAEERLVRAIRLLGPHRFREEDEEETG
jgi:hypothetical protein